MLFLPRNLLALERVCSPHAVRYAMNAVHLIDLGEGRYRAKATDGKALVVIQGEPPERKGNDPPALDDVPTGAAEALVPAEEWGKAFRMGAKGRRSQNEPVGVALSRERITFGASGQSLVTAPLEGRFPDVKTVLPQGRAMFTVKLSAGLLIELLRVAQLVAGPENDAVELHLFGGLQKYAQVPLGLSLRRDGQFFDALIMPLT